MSSATFVQEVHTPEARIEQIGHITGRHPDAILIGSMGRAAITSRELSVNKGPEARDLDFTTTTGELVPFSSADEQPFPVDNALAGQVVVAPDASYASVRFDPRRPDVSVEVPAEVFAPYQVSLGGLRVNTFHPDTLRNIHKISNNNRRKDRQSLGEFELALAGIDYTPLPLAYFEPLRDLQRMVRHNPSLWLQHVVERSRYIYDDFVPTPVQAFTRPSLIVLKKALRVADRKSITENPELLRTT